MKTMLSIALLLMVMVGCRKEEGPYLLHWPKNLNHPAWLNGQWVRVNDTDSVQSAYFNPDDNDFALSFDTHTSVFYGWSYDNDHKVVINNSETIIHPIVISCYLKGDTLVLYENSKLLKVQ